MKVVNQLAHLDLVETVRGRTGGVRLHYDHSEIDVGEVVRQLEQITSLVNCADGPCLFQVNCRLDYAFQKATKAFYKSSITTRSPISSNDAHTYKKSLCTVLRPINGSVSITFFAVKLRTYFCGPTFFGFNPDSVVPRWVVPNVLPVSACKHRYPVIKFVLMKIDYFMPHSYSVDLAPPRRIR